MMMCLSSICEREASLDNGKLQQLLAFAWLSKGSSRSMNPKLLAVIEVGTVSVVCAVLGKFVIGSIFTIGSIGGAVIGFAYGITVCLCLDLTNRKWFRKSLLRRGLARLGGALLLLMFTGGSLLYLGDAYSYFWPSINVNVSGQIRPRPNSPSEFHLYVWHQHPGEIKTGVITVVVSGLELADLSEAAKTEQWSFSSWSPNREAAKEFVFPIRADGNNATVIIQVHINAANVSAFSGAFRWDGYRWKR